jgi:hypothetical protein
MKHNNDRICEGRKTRNSLLQPEVTVGPAVPAIQPAAALAGPVRPQTVSVRVWSVRILRVVWLVMLLALSEVSSAQTYPCGNPSSGHCYGVASWENEPEYFGAYTDITQSSLRCARGCNGFVDDELWLVDGSSRACTANPFGMCWVEGGYIALDGGNNPVFFWADARPINQSTFNLHLLGAADPIGVVDHFMIIKDGRVTPQTFLVFIYNDSLSTLYNGNSVVPTGNPMQGKTIIIGQELAGTSGASADRANFTRNIWAVQSLGPEYVFWYVPQTNTGGVTSNNPPFGEWTINPGPPPPEGGQFTTHCCS